MIFGSKGGKLAFMRQSRCLGLCLSNRVCLKKQIDRTGLSVCGTPVTQKISPQTFKKPRRLFFHSLQFAIGHLALRFIPNCESSFQIGMSQECYLLSFRQGAIGYEGFNQTTQDNRKGRKLAFDFRFASWK
jgi:hypothetical protein